jgi:hypothetical protein
MPELQVLYTNYNNKITILNADADSLVLEGYTPERITKQGNVKYVEFNIQIGRGDSLWDENYDYKTEKYTLKGTFYKGGRILNKEQWHFKIKDLPWPDVFTTSISKTLGTRLNCASEYNCPLDLSYSIINWNVMGSSSGEGAIIPSSAVETFNIGQTIMVVYTIRSKVNGMIYSKTARLIIVP